MSVKDYECPVCFIFLLEPITLPCHHNICLKCFENIKLTLCPLCQCCFKDYKNSVLNYVELIDCKKTYAIMVEHKEKYLKAIQGLDYSSSSDDEIHTLLNKSGEIGQEYFHDLKMSEYEKKKLEDEEATLKLIEQFRNEDMIARNALPNNISNDKQFALNLFKKINMQSEPGSSFSLLESSSQELNSASSSTLKWNIYEADPSTSVSQPNHIAHNPSNQQISVAGPSMVGVSAIKSPKLETCLDRWIIKKAPNKTPSLFSTPINIEVPKQCIVDLSKDTPPVLKIANIICEKENIKNNNSPDEIISKEQLICKESINGDIYKISSVSSFRGKQPLCKSNINKKMNTSKHSIQLKNTLITESSEATDDVNELNDSKLDKLLERLRKKILSSKNGHIPNKSITTSVSDEPESTFSGIKYSSNVINNNIEGNTNMHKAQHIKRLPENNAHILNKSSTAPDNNQSDGTFTPVKDLTEHTDIVQVRPRKRSLKNYSELLGNNGHSFDKQHLEGLKKLRKSKKNVSSALYSSNDEEEVQSVPPYKIKLGGAKTKSDLSTHEKMENIPIKRKSERIKHKSNVK